MITIQALRSMNSVLRLGLGFCFWTSCGRNWIVPGAAPRMAPPNALDSHPASLQAAMRLHCLKKILRAGGSEPASRSRPADEVQHRRDRRLISANQHSYQPFHGLGGWRIPARFASLSHSFSSSLNSALEARHRAMTTSQAPSTIRARCARMISRSLRRIRFRSTAVPSFLGEIRPNLNPPGAASRSACKTRNLPG